MVSVSSHRSNLAWPDNTEMGINITSFTFGGGGNETTQVRLYDTTKVKTSLMKQHKLDHITQLKLKHN